MGLEGKTVALVVAAGSGIRSGSGIAKQYRQVAGKAVLAHAIDHLRHDGIDEVQVVVGEGQEKLYADAVGDRRVLPPIRGGNSRRASVFNGLRALAEQAPARILIHDAARPFLPSEVIDRLLLALDGNEGAVPVLPVADTLARAASSLGDPVSRDGLVRVQTPQAFRFDSIFAAHGAWREGDAEATDDAQVARAAGIDVVTVPGHGDLDKLTFEADFIRMERQAASSMVTRTGSGFDVHAFCEGDHVWLGGLRIAHERGLSGHSDADVALHAITDALLGAIAAGDIGEHFPPTDPRWRGAPSSEFVEHARQLVEARGGRIDHVDVTIICESPRLSPHKEEMRTNIARMLGLPSTGVSVKATTTERLGFTGRGEGVAAQALASVRLKEE